MKNRILVDQWLARSQSNLDRARAGKTGDTILFEDLCFDCQQAAEKSLKGLLVARDLESPHTHIIAALLQTLERNGIVIPEEIRDSSDLTDYAVHTRYPGMYEPIRDDEYQEALAVAERVVAWVHTELHTL
ncbi:MAG: HEPN domain-containing protein [Methanoregula sp.]|jgi:HEPN domain-containing protein|nr:HEPN domain-containing protein [Methanoregula sp.]